MAPDSHNLTPVFGSSIYGRRPLGLSATYSGFLTSEIGQLMISTSIPSSAAIIATFGGFGPDIPIIISTVPAVKEQLTPDFDWFESCHFEWYFEVILFDGVRKKLWSSCSDIYS